MQTTKPHAPYDAHDMDAAVAYTKETTQLFADGKADEAYARWTQDPLGGAQAEYAHVTAREFAEHMYRLHDREGNMLYPRPAGPLSAAAQKPPYDYVNTDAAVSYSQATNRLFADGKIDEAFAHWKLDPNGGGNMSFSGRTKEEFADAFYDIRDVQGKYLFPRPTPVTSVEDTQADDADPEHETTGMRP